jgi:hypothetical protein
MTLLRDSLVLLARSDRSSSGRQLTRSRKVSVQAREFARICLKDMRQFRKVTGGNTLICVTLPARGAAPNA